MLELRPNRELCDRDLPADSTEALPWQCGELLDFDQANVRCWLELRLSRAKGAMTE